MKKQEKLVLFDCDGVIVDSAHHLYEGTMAFIESHGGKPFSREVFNNAFKGNVIEDIFKHAQFKDPHMRLTAQDMEKYFSYDDAQVFPEIPSLLSELVQNYTLVIITSTPIDIVTKKFEAEGLSEYFAAYLGPEASLYKNEKAKMALEEFNMPVESAVFISDTAGDIKEVNKTGVKTIGVTWGIHSKEDLQEANPTSIVDSIEELKQKIYE